MLRWTLAIFTSQSAPVRWLLSSADRLVRWPLQGFTGASGLLSAVLGEGILPEEFGCPARLV